MITVFKSVVKINQVFKNLTLAIAYHQLVTSFKNSARKVILFHVLVFSGFQLIVFNLLITFLVCKLMAEAIHKSVSTLGCKSFLDSQKNACTCKSIKTSKVEL